LAVKVIVNEFGVFVEVGVKLAIDFVFASAQDTADEVAVVESTTTLIVAVPAVDFLGAVQTICVAVKLYIKHAPAVPKLTEVRNGAKPLPTIVISSPPLEIVVGVIDVIFKVMSKAKNP